MTILKNLGDNKFEVEIDSKESSYRETNFAIAHDYVLFEGSFYPKNSDGSTNFDCVPTAKIQIPIKAFVEIILPKLVASKYCQPEHLEDRVHTEDDTLWNSKHAEGKFNGPRYKKGDKYPAYSFQSMVVKYWDSVKESRMVAILEHGEKHFNYVTEAFYNKYIKNVKNEEN